VNTIWKRVGDCLEKKLTHMQKAAGSGQPMRVNTGQIQSLLALADRLPNNGLIIADEVGMGKTRIATELTESIWQCKGRVAILAPAGLGFQWKRELAMSQVPANDVLRSVMGFGQYLAGTDESVAHWSACVMLLSHGFGALRIKEHAHPLRWCLLPAVAAAWHGDDNLRARERRKRRVMALSDDGGAIVAFAEKITAEPLAQEWLWRDAFMEFCAQVSWESLLRPENYALGTPYRAWLHRVIGLGLGRFDLVLIDEAHKSRGDDSSLTRLLKDILWLSPNVRRVAMTATPVELDPHQWIQSLDRIGLRTSEEKRDPSIDTIRHAIETYQNALCTFARALRHICARFETTNSVENARCAQVMHRVLIAFAARG